MCTHHGSGRKKRPIKTRTDQSHRQHDATYRSDCPRVILAPLFSFFLGEPFFRLLNIETAQMDLLSNYVFCDTIQPSSRAVPCRASSIVDLTACGSRIRTSSRVWRCSLAHIIRDAVLCKPTVRIAYSCSVSKGAVFWNHCLSEDVANLHHALHQAVPVASLLCVHSDYLCAFGLPMLPRSTVWR